MKKTKLQIFSENAKILAAEILKDKESYRQQVQSRNITQMSSSENQTITTKSNFSDKWSTIVNQEKMSIILDKLKNNKK